MPGQQGPPPPMGGPGPGGPGPGPGPVSMQVSPRSPQAPPQPQRNVLHRGPPPGQGFPPNGVPPPGRGFDPRMGPPPGGMPPMGMSAKKKPLSAMSRSDIFGLQGWTPGCKGLHLGILNIVVHHQDRDKCLCRVSLISRSHLQARWDQDMECLPHSNNKGVESRSINGDKRLQPGREWKEHTRTRPLDPALCAINQSLVLFYWTLFSL